MAERDEPMSLRTRKPNLASPIALIIPNGAILGLRTEAISNNDIDQVDPVPTVSRPGVPSNTEAHDYMNGALPQTCTTLSFTDGAVLGSTSSKPLPTLKYTASSLGPSTSDNIGSSTGTATPPGRRSVQFVRLDVPEHPSHMSQDSLGNEEGDIHIKGKASSLMSKLKALASAGSLQTHTRSLSEEGTSSTPLSPTGDRSGVQVPETLEEQGSDIDADAEETADEETPGGASRLRRKHRARRFLDYHSQTVPTTPNLRVPYTESPAVASSRAHLTIKRRSTMPDGIDEPHLSEEEGRDRLGKQSAWRRGSMWIGSARGQSYSGSTAQDGDATPSNRRQSNFRRITGFGAGSDGEAQPLRMPFLSGGDRASTFGAQKWKKLKHGLKMLGQRKEEHKIDYLKSAELMAELRAGAPAALMLASMIQRDEHGNKRIPVLLEQVKLKITGSRSTDETKESERHVAFRIELEYGSGLNRMKWVIHRSLRDFINLHLRYKLQGSSDKYIQLRSDVDSRPKQPRFPMAAFPYLRGVRGLGDSEEDEGETVRIYDTVGEATHSETERPVKRKKRHASLALARRKSSIGGTDTGLAADSLAANHARRIYNERQRRKLEQYLQEMIHWLIFRADSNRLCKFLELSALGVRLAAEGSYHGKEGYLVIQSSKGLDFRRILTPKGVFARHSPKWFLVRHSYIVCVDSPENMQIYDVFLLDPKFQILSKRKKLKDSTPTDIEKAPKSSAPRPQHHRLKIQNSERKIKLLAKNERQLRQFEESIQFMIHNSRWSKPNRFDSFAPVRTGVHAQWLVDGRDYMWNVSRAINMAKDVIYIHDWWLSPQLYMRRPAAISQKWRLDRLLRKKAREGVKIFIIIYRNVEAAVPIDSEFTKFSLLDLHPNIFVQRSPNQFKKNQFFFAHHEKICIVDHTVAFVGGIDLCFGRWDTPQHSVCDDKPTGFEPSDKPKDADHCQLWPGKDYSNPRVQDFFQLSEPYAEMYDRSKTPRMPWHDISMQIVGQPARDLTRHFVQRWNYVLRGRKPTRPTPFLLPPPDYSPADLEALGLNGTCEVQILRSASNWSLGVEETEHSIMNAYCKLIEESEHFIYIENQFFITSCETMNVKIVNKIGDAIVERAVRAYKNNQSWRCVILIPLMPGFQNTVDAPDGTSVRLIMQCQFHSISRGEGSVFERLRSEGMEPEDFVSFYSLRAWGKIGPRKTLVTEQLYIHAKAIIVDDRIALIGSANINERSMLGFRDSECAAVVRDTDMIWSTMDGKPYLVGRFAHTLRIRLMREHLGLDVDEVMEEERRTELDREDAGSQFGRADDHDNYDSDVEPSPSVPDAATVSRQHEIQDELLARQERMRDFSHDIKGEQCRNPNEYSNKSKITLESPKHVTESDGGGSHRWRAAVNSGIARGQDGKNPGAGNSDLPPLPILQRRTTDQLGLPQLSQLPPLPVLDDTDIGGPPAKKVVDGPPVESSNPFLADIKRPIIERDCMRDPLNDSFFEDIWRLVAENNTKIFRRVFRCNPDNEVTNWHEYREFQAYAERFAQAQAGTKSQSREEQETGSRNGPPGAFPIDPGSCIIAQDLSNVPNNSAPHKHSMNPQHVVSTMTEKAEADDKTRKDPFDTKALNSVNKRNSNEVDSHTLSVRDESLPLNQTTLEPVKALERPSAHRATFTAPTEKTSSNATIPDPPLNQGSVKRRRRGTTKTRKGFSASDDLLNYEDAEQLLSMVQGSLVLFSYDWLKSEEHNSNWLYQVDQVAPLQI